MKRNLYAFLWCITTAFFIIHSDLSPADNKDDNKIELIREKYRKINSDVDNKRYKTEVAYVESDSNYSGVIMGYYENNELVKIYYLQSHSKGRTSLEYYFDNQKLLFAFYYNIFYNHDISAPGALIYDKVTEEKYYFSNNKLIKWMNDQEEVSLNQKKIKNTSARIIKDMNDLVERLKKK